MLVVLAAMLVAAVQGAAVLVDPFPVAAAAVSVSRSAVIALDTRDGSGRALTVVRGLRLQNASACCACVTWRRVRAGGGS